MSKPLFTLYPNARVTPDVWRAFVARCESEGIPPGIRLYEFIIAYAKDKDPAAVALGSKTSPAKARAARENGKLGGRPRKDPDADR